MWIIERIWVINKHFYSVSGYTESINHDHESTDLDAFVLCAENATMKVHGDKSRHHFIALQLPLNLFEPQSMHDFKQAKSYGMMTFGNRPLNWIAREEFGAGDQGRIQTHLKLHESVPISPERALVKNALACSKMYPDNLTTLATQSLFSASSPE